MSVLAIANTLQPRRDNFGLTPTVLETTVTIERVLFVFMGIALYATIEILILIFLRFRTWNTLYFWSLIVSSVGILPYSLGILFKFFGVIQGHPTVFIAVTMIVIGWHMMVTGQSVVLYSRLHLICRNQKVIRYALWMIIGNWFVSNVPITLFAFTAASPDYLRYQRAYSIWERLMLSLYFVQEVVLSSIYVVEVMRMLKPETFEGMSSGQQQESATSKRAQSTSSGHSFNFSQRLRTATSQRILRHLFMINIVVIILDATLVVTEYIGHYEVQVCYKAFVYATKLKLEFKILNQLTDIAQQRLRASQGGFNTGSNTSAGSSTHCSPGNTFATQTLRRESVNTVQLPLSPLTVARPIGVLPDIEKDEDQLLFQPIRSDSIIHNNLMPDHARTEKPALASAFARRSSESRRALAGPQRTVSFSEGAGPSLQPKPMQESDLEARWEEALERAA